MARNLHEFLLTPEELIQLREAVAEDRELSSSVLAAKAETAGGLTLWFDLETTEKLRDYLTEQLARIGFDEDYSITKRGAILEALIDKFYIT